MEQLEGQRKGAWTDEEDELLRSCIQKYGEGKWHLIPERTGSEYLSLGLNRCRRSCRLRWLNYVSLEISRGELADDEVDMIIRLHRLLGNRWTMIAGRLPGRTANDVRSYWHSNLRRVASNKEHKKEKPEETTVKTHTVIKTKPRRFSKNSPWLIQQTQMFAKDQFSTTQFDDDHLATGRLPGSAANDVRNYWRSNLRRVASNKEDKKEKPEETTVKPHIVIKLKPRRFSKNSPWLIRHTQMFAKDQYTQLDDDYLATNGGSRKCAAEESEEWWEVLNNLMVDDTGNMTSSSGQNGKLKMMDSCDEEFATMSTNVGEGDPSLDGHSFWNDFPFDANL